MNHPQGGQLLNHHGLPLASANFRKSRPPIIGEKQAPGWGQDGAIQRILPGGGLLNFDLSALTLQDFRSMRDHYQINISLRLLTFMVHQVNWRIEGSDEKIRKFIEENIEKNWSRIVRALSPAYWAGYAPIVVQYQNDANRVVLDKLKDVTPEDASINWKDVPGKPSTTGGMAPKIRIFDGIRVPGQNDPVPAENTMWYSLLTEAGNMMGSKLLKPAFPAWFFSQMIHAYANNYFERFGEPIPIGRAPFDASVPDGKGNSLSGQEVIIEVMQNLRNRSVVALPSDRSMNGQGQEGDFEYDVKYLESQMRGADFERYLTRLDEEMSLGIFTPVLLYRTADVGSYNLGEAHMQVFLIMNNALVADIAEVLNRYLIRRLIDFNFGPNAGKDIVFAPKKMGEATQATLRQIATAVIQGGTIKPDTDDLALALGMKLEEVEIVTEPDGGPGAPAPAPDSGDPADKPGPATDGS